MNHKKLASIIQQKGLQTRKSSSRVFDFSIYFKTLKKGKSYRGQVPYISTIVDYNRYRKVKRVSEWTVFSRSVVFPRFYMLVTCLTGLICV